MNFFLDPDMAYLLGLIVGREQYEKLVEKGN